MSDWSHLAGYTLSRSSARNLELTAVHQLQLDRDFREEIAVQLAHDGCSLIAVRSQQHDRDPTHQIHQTLKKQGTRTSEKEANIFHGSDFYSGSDPSGNDNLSRTGPENFDPQSERNTTEVPLIHSIGYVGSCTKLH